MTTKELESDLKTLRDLQDLDERKRRELTQNINARKKQIAVLKEIIISNNQTRIA